MINKSSPNTSSNKQEVFSNNPNIVKIINKNRESFNNINYNNNRINGMIKNKSSNEQEKNKEVGKIINKQKKWDKTINFNNASEEGLKRYLLSKDLSTESDEYISDKHIEYIK